MRTAAEPRAIPLPGPASVVGLLEAAGGALALEPGLVVLSGDWLARPGPADEPLTVIGSRPLEIAETPVALLAALAESSALGPLAGLAADLGGVEIGGGWIGRLDYALGRQFEPAAGLGPEPPGRHPSAAGRLAFHDHVLVHRPSRGWRLEMLHTRERADALVHAEARWRRWLAAATRAPSTPATPARSIGPVLSVTGAGAAGHLAAVAACRERIAAGDLYQANLCFELVGELDEDPVGLFARGLVGARPRFGALLPGLIGLSPERFLRRDGETVWTEPMKGTRPQPTAVRPGSGTDRADRDRRARARDLAEHPKDAAEHVMIVDLMRNDLGRVCAYGTVTADPPRVEDHAGVLQLVSTVTGQLRSGTSDAELVGATFPPGSVTGAPKLAAMALIAELETTARGAYTGAYGILSPLAGLDLAVAIRTFELHGRELRLGVGGGIVADSVPRDELEEAHVKARGPVSAIGGRLALDLDGAAPLRRRGRAAPPAALDHGLRPDPAHGVFETLLAEHGRPVALRAHLDRLTQSVGHLYGRSLPDDLAGRIDRAVRSAGPFRARVRVRVDPTGEPGIDVIPAPPPRPDRPPVALTPWRLPGGLGTHKWNDRRLLDALARAAPGTVALLLDADDHVLEAAWANVWVSEAGRWLTPPADGRLLPGVTRAARLAEPDHAEAPISLERLAAAGAVALSSAISGWTPARLLG